MEFTVDFKDIEQHAVFMHKMRRYAIPSVVKGVLNDLSYETKTKNMVKSAHKNFTSRTTNDNFFRANSKHVKAMGKDIATMKAQTTFFENKMRLGAERNRAIDDLQYQEDGGEIKRKTFIPLDNARKGNSESGLVQAKYRLSKMNRFIDANSDDVRMEGKARLRASARFMKAGRMAASEKIPFVSPFENKDGSRTVYMASFTAKKGIVKYKALYTLKSKRSVRVKATNFLMEAAKESSKNAHEYMSTRLDYWWNKKDK